MEFEQAVKMLVVPAVALAFFAGTRFSAYAAGNMEVLGLQASLNCVSNPNAEYGLIGTVNKVVIDWLGKGDNLAVKISWKGIETSSKLATVAVTNNKSGVEQNDDIIARIFNFGPDFEGSTQVLNNGSFGSLVRPSIPYPLERGQRYGIQVHEGEIETIKRPDGGMDIKLGRMLGRTEVQVPDCGAPVKTPLRSVFPYVKYLSGKEIFKNN